MAVDAVNGDLEETFRPFAALDLGRCHGLLDSGLGVHQRKVQLPQCASVPGDAHGRKVPAVASGEMQLFSKCKSGQSANAAEAAIDRPVLGAAPDIDQPANGFVQTTGLYRHPEWLFESSAGRS